MSFRSPHSQIAESAHSSWLWVPSQVMWQANLEPTWEGGSWPCNKCAETPHLSIPLSFQSPLPLRIHLLRRGRGRRLLPVAGNRWRLDRHRLARSGGARWASQSGQDGGSSGGRWWRDCDSMVTLHLCMVSQEAKFPCFMCSRSMLWAP